MFQVQLQVMVLHTFVLDATKICEKWLILFFSNMAASRFYYVAGK